MPAPQKGGAVSDWYDLRGKGNLGRKDTSLASLS